MEKGKVKEFVNLCIDVNEEDYAIYIKAVKTAEKEFILCLPNLTSAFAAKSVDEIALTCNQLYSCLSHKLKSTRKNKEDEFMPSLYVCSATLTLMDLNVSPKMCLLFLTTHFKASVLDCLKLLKKFSIDLAFKILNEHSRIAITSIIQTVIWSTDSSLWSKVDECDGVVPSYKDLKNVMEEISQLNIKTKWKNISVSKKSGTEESKAKNDTVSVNCTRELKCYTWKPSLMAAFLETYNYSYTLLKSLCDTLCITDFLQDIWNAFNHAFSNHCRELLHGKQLDQLLLCVVYAVCKSRPTVHQLEFKIILQCYKMLPNSDPDINKCVSSPTSYASPSKSPKTAANTTPIGNMLKDRKSTSKDALVTFYNRVFLPEMKSYFKEHMKKKDMNGSSNTAKHSPLPDSLDSPVRVSSNVYISPLKSALPSPPRCIEYKFSSSPGSQLQHINEMVRNSPVSKRIATDDLESSHNTKCAKKISFQPDNPTSSNSRSILPR